ncbi:hypothetical protein BDN72DRAFT_834538 [Pluteus cervinus]|uniref:Uncharacterized protein n=1 Tax=Pluteus cervinus TaxID=181527 RepID=A0ACD3B6B8_9AGAR|nr:hypothetical protein BDN72DRAFT_834538 [Pluteus cervinus]
MEVFRTSGHFWSHKNWSALKYGYDELGTLRFPERLLKGRLRDNTYEYPFYESIFDVKPFDYNAMMNGLFAAKSRVYHGWEPEHWLCDLCIGTFIRDNLHYWLQKRKEQQLLRETGNGFIWPCFDGYDCKLQGDKDHSRECTHFYDPQTKPPRRLEPSSER